MSVLHGENRSSRFGFDGSIRRLFVLVIINFLFSCGTSTMDGKYKISTLMRCRPISRNFVLCDSLTAGEEDCYMIFQRKRYVKTEVIRFSKNVLAGVDAFKAEGLVQYTGIDLKKDSLLFSLRDWNISNDLVLRGDSVVVPFNGLIVHRDRKEKKIYSTVDVEAQQWLYVVGYW